ncbi:MAG: phosphoenolpyruvate carboxylase [Terrimonas sp.]|nr:phosphoenolpyruvate carboxylase [Terrimonas sp.]
MDHHTSAALQQFRNQVGLKFQLYNSLFTSLPFHRIEKTGILLSLLLSNCEDGFKKNQSPEEIIEEFFKKHTAFSSEEEKLDLLFRFVQYAERQVVLFDALEDAAFRNVHDMSGAGTLKHLQAEVEDHGKEMELTEKLKDFSVRLVLTAHPTQFYPGPVLAIINDLAKALVENNTNQINMYLQQLGKTPFFKKQKPTPYDEAISLIWYLENVFYAAAGRISSFLKNEFPDAIPDDNPVVRMGFWPGGDRDGNPFVKADTTLKVAEALRGSIIKCYYIDVRRIRRRLTFEGVETKLGELEKNLYNNIFIPGQRTDLSKKDILKTLFEIRDTIVYKHNGLFLHLLDNFINKVKVFGLHFASLDLRQDSRIHGQLLDSLAEKSSIIPPTYPAMSASEKIEVLLGIREPLDPSVLSEGMETDTIETFRVMKSIQQFNGEDGCDRYIISQCNSALNVFEVFGLYLASGWKKEEMTVDIIPLFETIDDLKHAGNIMRELYENPDYKNHLGRRQHKQTIMLGFSDGTKDGGYLMANWSIYKAKEELTSISKEYGFDVIFFDGRGGPPARGGGKTHKFYASMGRNISNKEIQLTIQGQTVSSNFGIIDSAQFNIEKLIHAGIANDLFNTKTETFSEQEELLMSQLSEISYRVYSDLKNHPYFLDYLSHASPLRFYGETNIGSRPSKRGGSSRLDLKDLRAIPFVGSWSQLKQNVTGYYGVGSALLELEKAGRLPELKQLYKESKFFKTLLDNCEMSMMKCFFPLTAFLRNHKKYGELWQMIFEEYELTKKYLSILSETADLMTDYPVEQVSIQMRERIVLPLLTIQQYAITKVRKMEETLVDAPIKNTYGKLVMRCSFGIINAGRNSA